MVGKVPVQLHLLYLIIGIYLEIKCGARLYVIANYFENIAITLHQSGHEFHVAFATQFHKVRSVSR